MYARRAGEAGGGVETKVKRHPVGFQCDKFGGENERELPPRPRENKTEKVCPKGTQQKMRPQPSPPKPTMTDRLRSHTLRASN